MGKKTVYFKKDDLVTVEWEDAYSDKDWKDSLEDAKDHKECIATNIGWVLFHNKQGIMLYNARINDGTIGGRDFIPRGMIRKVEKIGGV